MSHKNKNKNQADNNRFDEVENLNPPEVPNDSDQAKGTQPAAVEESFDGMAKAAEEHPAETTKTKSSKNSFGAILAEVNEKRKARLKKILDGKRDKEAGS